MSTYTDHKLLNRSVGIFGATLLGLGSILGTGVYFGIPTLTAQSGMSLILPIVTAAVLGTCNALSSAQLAACYPVSGGTYEYGYHLLNPWAGFAAGWLFLCAKSASAATAALQVTANLLSGPTPLPACGIVAAITVLVISGLRRSTWINTGLVAMSVIGLAVFFTVAMKSSAEDLTSSSSAAAVTTRLAEASQPETYQRSPMNRDNSFNVPLFLRMTALIFVAFTGYGRVATLGEEIRNPRRSIPLAVVVTLLISATLYILTAVGVNRFQPGMPDCGTLTALTSSTGSTASHFVALGAVAAMLGVLLNLLLGLSRVVLAMARRNDLPVLFAGLNSRRTTPVYAVLFVTAIVTALVVLQDSHSAWSLSAVTVLVYYGLTNLAALKLPPEHRLYPRWIAVTGLCGCFLLAAHVDLKSWMTGVCLLLAGLAGRSVSQAFRSLS